MSVGVVTPDVTTLSWLLTVYASVPCGALRYFTGTCLRNEVHSNGVNLRIDIRIAFFSDVNANCAHIWAATGWGPAIIMPRVRDTAAECRKIYPEVNDKTVNLDPGEVGANRSLYKMHRHMRICKSDESSCD